MYELELGPIEENISKQAQNMGKRQPQAMADKPKPLAGSTLYHQAFHTLDSERHLGMSVGAIPWSAMYLYATVYEFSEAQQVALYFIVARMDNAKLRWISEVTQPTKKG